VSKTTLEWGQEIDKRRDSLVALRRDFHRHPELSFEENRTAEITRTTTRSAWPSALRLSISSPAAA
jgi:metal-dependent amidase/aminoacylase/carboxypeptidase family protein